VGDREILETFEFSVQKYIRNRRLSSWAKIFVDQCNYNNIDDDDDNNNNNAHTLRKVLT